MANPRKSSEALRAEEGSPPGSAAPPTQVDLLAMFHRAAVEYGIFRPSVRRHPLLDVPLT